MFIRPTGDLDAGLRLLADSDEVQAKQLKKMEALSQPSDEPEERDQFELAADDAWIIGGLTSPSPSPPKPTLT